MHAGVFKRKQPAPQHNGSPSASSADAQPLPARHSSNQELTGLSRTPVLQAGSSATASGDECKQPVQTLPGESGHSSSAALTTVSPPEQALQQVSQPASQLPAGSAATAPENAPGEASAPSSGSISSQTLAPFPAAADQMSAAATPGTAVSQSGSADDAEQQEARESSSEGDHAESRLQTPRAAGTDEDRPDDGLEASGGSEDWTKVPPPGTSDGTLGDTEGSLPVQGDGVTATGSRKEAGPRSRSTAMQLRRQLAHGIPQVDMCLPSLHCNVSMTCVQPYCTIYAGFRWGEAGFPL